MRRFFHQPSALLAFAGLFAFLAAAPPRERNPVHPLNMQGGVEDAGAWPLFSPPASGANFAIVLLAGPVTPKLTAELQAAGASVLNYLPENALLIRADAAAAQKILFIPEIQGLRALPERLKISPEVAALAQATGGQSASLLVRLHNQANGTAAIARLHAAAGLLAGENLRMISDTGHGARMVLTTRSTNLLARARSLAADPDVLWIEPSPVLHFYNDAARWVTQNFDSSGSGAEAIVAPVHAHGIHGEGQIVGIIDDGLDPTHTCFYDSAQGVINPDGIVNYNQRKVIYYKTHDWKLPWENCGGEGHGAHTSGTIACDSNGNGTWDYNSLNGDPPDGLAVAAKIAMSDGGTTDPPGIPADLQTVFQETYDVGARVHSNSWGSCGSASACYIYNGQSHDADEFMWEHPDMLLVFAAANEGGTTNTVTPPGSAKNIVTVGATNRGTGANTIAGFSSRGPTADGRIKPTVTAPGVNTNSVLATNGGTCPVTAVDPATIAPADPTLHTGATTMSGTSMATPAVAASAALIRQYYMEGWYPSGTKTAANGFLPSAALLKATLINGARKMSYNLPGNEQGYGRVSLKESLFFAGDANYTRRQFVDDHKRGLVQGDGAVTYKINVTASTTPFKVTLVWTDAPPAILSGKTLVNDLNLKVTQPNGSTYYLGNAFTTTTGFSTPFTSGGTANNTDVEEEVWVQSPAVGNWTITVTPANIPVGPQPYALDVTGALLIPVAGTPVVDSTRISDPAPGNNDGAADPGETVNLQLVLREVAGSAINGLNGTLSTLAGTPAGVSVGLPGPFSFGNLAANGTALNAAPFQVALTSSVPCGSLIPLHLALTDGAANAYSLDFGIRAGSPGKTPAVSVIDNFDSSTVGAAPNAALWTVAGKTLVDNTIITTGAADTGANAVHLLQNSTAPGSWMQTQSLNFSAVNTARLNFSYWANNILSSTAGPFFRVEICAGAVATTCAPTAAAWQLIYGNPNHYSGTTTLNFDSNTLTPPVWSPIGIDLTPTNLIGNGAANLRFRFSQTGTSAETTTAAYVDSVSLNGYSYACNLPAASQLLLKADKTGGMVHLYWTGGIAPYALSRFQNGVTSIGPLTQSGTAYDDNVLADANSYQWVVQ